MMIVFTVKQQLVTGVQTSLNLACNQLDGQYISCICYYSNVALLLEQPYNEKNRYPRTTLLHPLPYQGRMCCHRMANNACTSMNRWALRAFTSVHLHLSLLPYLALCVAQRGMGRFWFITLHRVVGSWKDQLVSSMIEAKIPVNVICSDAANLAASCATASHRA